MQACEARGDGSTAVALQWHARTQHKSAARHAALSPTRDYKHLQKWQDWQEVQPFSCTSVQSTFRPPGSRVRASHLTRRRRCSIM